jgi:hypothetical protein
MTVLIDSVTASGPARADAFAGQTALLSDTARAKVASEARSAEDCRELLLAIGLAEINADGHVAATNPWDAEAGVLVTRSPVGRQGH